MISCEGQLGVAWGELSLSLLIGEGETMSSMPFESPWLALDTWLWG